MIRQKEIEQLQGYVQRVIVNPESIGKYKKLYISLRRKHGLTREEAEELFYKALETEDFSNNEILTENFLESENVEGLESTMREAVSLMKGRRV